MQHMKKCVKITLAAAVATALCDAFCAQTVFVSPNGSDTAGTGTEEKPFASLSKAIEVFCAAEPGDFEIRIAEGEYYFDKGISILPRHTKGKTLSITGPKFSSEPKVRLIGGIKIEAINLERVSDKNVLSKIPADARGALYKIDLKKFGVKKLGEVIRLGWSTWNSRPIESEAFLNRKPMVPARYPNDDSLLKIGKVFDPGSITHFVGSNAYVPLKNENRRGATFGYDFDRPARWANAQDAFLRGNFSVGWAYDQIKIKKIDTAAKTITLSDFHVYGVRSNTPPKGSRDYADRAGLEVRGYQVFNLIEELDMPGEYFIDRKNLVFYTILESKPKDGDCFYFSLLPDPILSISGSENIKIQNIEFSVTRNSPIRGEFCRNIEINKCFFRSCGRPMVLNGVSLKRRDESDYSSRMSKNNKILNCKFFDNATGGAAIGGGNRRTLESSNVLISNCTFNKNSLRVFCGGYALSISGVGVRFANSRISNQRQSTLVFTGNNHIIEKNIFERCCEFANDYGVVYTYSNLAQLGNVIRYNFFTNNRSNFGPSAGVYVDESNAGVLVSHNIFCNTGNNAGASSFGAVYIHGGCETRAEKNIFINCKSAFGSQTWTDEKYAKKLQGEAKWRASIDIENGPYHKAYPRLSRILDPSEPRINYAFHNKIFNSSMALNGLLLLYGNSYISPSDAKAVRNNQHLTLRDVKKYFGNDPLVKHILSRDIGPH